MKILISIFLLGVLCSIAQSQVGVTFNVLYNSNGHLEHWSRIGLQYYVNPNIPSNQDITSNQFTAAVNSAFQAWQNVGSGFGYTLSYLGTTTHTVDVLDNQNTVFMSDNNDDLLPFNASSFRAATMPVSDPETGEITDRDIVLNCSEIYDPKTGTYYHFQWSVTNFNIDSKIFDAQSIVTHEVGHFLGLAHSDDSPAYYPATDVGRYNYPTMMSGSFIELCYPSPSVCPKQWVEYPYLEERTLAPPDVDAAVYMWDHSITTGNVSGTISQNTIWAGNISVTGSVTINSGVTLSIAPNTVVSFAQGTSLVVYGKILAIGSSGKTIEFTSSGTWSGITISGSNANSSILDYCNVDKVLTYGGSAVTVNGATGVAIKHSIISNNVNYGTRGIYLASAGNPELFANTISGNGGDGVLFYNTNGNFYANTVIGNSANGVNCSYSSPSFGKTGWYAYSGNNLITGGTWGIYAYASSYPLVGSYASSYFGYNSIYGNSSGRVLAGGNSSVAAESCWWGSSSPSSSWFQTSGGSIYRNPYLTYDPLNYSMKSIPIPAAQANSGDDPDQLDLRDVAEARVSGNLKEAKEILISLLSSAKTDGAVVSIAREGLNLFRDSNDSGLRSSIEDLFSDYSIIPEVELILGKMALSEGRITDADRVLSSMTQTQKGTELEKAALLDRFFYENSKEEVTEKEKSMLLALVASFPDDENIRQAQWMAAIKGSVSLEESAAAAGAQLASVTSGIQVYPNPFNPSTNFRFVLPHSSKVTLRIFNILGQVVGTLVDHELTAGEHQFQFDGSHLASGMYFYRLVLNNKVKSGRIVLAK